MEDRYRNICGRRRCFGTSWNGVCDAYSKEAAALRAADEQFMFAQKAAPENIVTLLRNH